MKMFLVRCKSLGTDLTSWSRLPWFTSRWSMYIWNELSAFSTRKKQHL